MLGEIEGEHYNISFFKKGEKDLATWQIGPQKETNLMVLLDRLRAPSLQKDQGLTIWNIVMIWKELRGDLSGVDFHDVRLTGIQFNHTSLYRHNKKIYHSAIFQNATISFDQFCTMGPQGIIDYQFSKDGKVFYFVSGNIELGTWNLDTGEYHYHLSDIDASIATGIIDISNQKACLLYQEGLFIERSLQTTKILKKEDSPILRAAYMAANQNEKGLLVGTKDGKLYSSVGWVLLKDFGAKKEIKGIYPDQEHDDSSRCRGDVHL